MKESAGLFLGVCLIATANSAAGDPRIESWFTTCSGQYARLVETDAELAAGTPKTTWSRQVSQTLPTYCGVHEISYSSDWVYLRSTGLGSHVMGPWYQNASRVGLFVNLPKNMAVLYRIPRNPTVPVTKANTGGGAIGCFVDGVAMYDSRDAFSYNSGSGSPGTETGMGGSGYWNRDAYVNERLTFDFAYAHQPGSGQYHYHANPPALRHLLGDNVHFDPATKTYSEDTANTNLQHSPILGWVRDGFPVYGPYGYSIATDATSGIRRMTSGFRLRDINASGVSARSTYPLWAMRAKGLASTNLTTHAGPTVSGQRPLGRYLEDSDYLGDLGFVQGTHFDLNEHNVRYCVTPEFPGGTWAYFVCIDSNGAPAFPYNIGRQYWGAGTGPGAGGAVASIAEPVAVHFSGGPRMPTDAGAPVLDAATGDVTLVWSAVDGGTYTIEASTNLTAWPPVRTNLPPSVQSSFPAPSVYRSQVMTNAAAGSSSGFYRMRRVATNAFDNAGFAP